MTVITMKSRHTIDGSDLDFKSEIGGGMLDIRLFMGIPGGKIDERQVNFDAIFRIEENLQNEEKANLDQSNIIGIGMQIIINI